MSLPDWISPVARYMLEEGLRNTLQISAIALIGSTIIGITLGTLLTIRFLPLRVTSEDLERIHGTDERIAVDDYAALIGFLGRLIVNLSDER